MLFAYKATTKDGRSISGTVEAANKQALLALLRKQEVHPVVIEVQKAAKQPKDNSSAPKRKSNYKT